MKPGVEWPASVPSLVVSRRSATPLREMLTHVFRDRWRIALVFALGMLLTVIAALLPAKKYTAEAALLLRLGREYIYTPELGDMQGGAPIAYDREQLQLAEVKILTSRDLTEQVLDKMGLAALYPGLADGDPEKSRNASVLSFERALKAELVKGSNVLEMSFTHRDPQVAAQVLTTLIDLYLEKRQLVFSSASAGTAAAEFAARQKALNDVEARLTALKGQRSIRAFSEEQSLLLAQRNALELRYAEAALQQSQSGSRAQALQQSLKQLTADVMLSTETLRSEAAESARRTLLDLRLKERDLAAKYAETHPLVVDVRSDIRRTEGFLGELDKQPIKTSKSGRNPARDVAEAELLKTQAEQRQASAALVQLKSQREAIDQRLAAFAASEGELQTLERERRLAEQNYEAASKRLRDEKALEELDRKRRSNVSVVQPPAPPLQGQSIAPLVLVVGTVLSACLALLTAFLSALWRDGFLSPEQMERELQIPVLAAIPERGA
jgi:uncharacterized protein involved in exopolysaccharide biosynthesis